MATLSMCPIQVVGGRGIGTSVRPRSCLVSRSCLRSLPSCGRGAQDMIYTEGSMQAIMVIGDIYRRIGASYYGYRDEEDGILEKLEGPAEQKMRAATLADSKEMEKIKQEARRAVMSGEVAEVGAVSKILFEEEEDVVEEERRIEREREEKEKEIVVHVPLPDGEEIKKKVLEKKKQEMLNKYTSSELLEELIEAKTLLNIQQ